MTPLTTALFIGGRSGVGKSTVALALHDLLAERAIQHALIEGDNLDLAHPEPWRAYPDAHLAEANLAAMWSNYRALGYRRLIYPNTVSVLEMPRLSAALGAPVDAIGVLLRASSDSIEHRLQGREQGDSLTRHLERSTIAGARLDAEASSEVYRVDTDGLTAPQVAARLLDLTGWDRPSG